MMKITIQMPDDLLEPALQEHLNTGVTMQDYVRWAVRYFNKARQLVKDGRTIGHCEKDSYTEQKGYITKFEPRLDEGEN